MTMRDLNISCPLCHTDHTVKVDDSDRYDDKRWVECPRLPPDYQLSVYQPKGMPRFIDIERKFFEGLLESRREIMAWVAAASPVGGLDVVPAHSGW